MKITGASGEGELARGRVRVRVPCMMSADGIANTCDSLRSGAMLISFSPILLLFFAFHSFTLRSYALLSLSLSVPVSLCVLMTSVVVVNGCCSSGGHVKRHNSLSKTIL